MAVDGVDPRRIDSRIGNGSANTSFDTFGIGSGHGAAHPLAAAIDVATDNFRVDSRTAGTRHF